MYYIKGLKAKSCRIHSVIEILHDCYSEEHVKEFLPLLEKAFLKGVVLVNIKGEFSAGFLRETFGHLSQKYGAKKCALKFIFKAENPLTVEEIYYYMGYYIARKIGFWHRLKHKLALHTGEVETFWKKDDDGKHLYVGFRCDTCRVRENEYRIPDRILYP